MSTCPNRPTSWPTNLKKKKTGFKQSKTWPLNIGPICCSETSVTDNHFTLRNIPEERISHLHCGGNLKSRKQHLHFAFRLVLPIKRSMELRVRSYVTTEVINIPTNSVWSILVWRELQTLLPREVTSDKHYVVRMCSYRELVYIAAGTCHRNTIFTVPVSHTRTDSDRTSLLYITFRKQWYPVFQ
jgi:hypothetical protein